MPNPIAVQLYSVRDLLTDDFAGVVKQIADMGYIGVEPFGLDIEKAQMQAKVFADLGLQVPSIHGDLPLGADQNKVLDIVKAIGTRRVYCNRGADQFETVDAIKQFRDDLNAAAAIAAENGFIIGYHNHWWEFDRVEDTGKTGYALLQEGLDPAVELQVDTYWVKVGNHDPAALVKDLGERAHILHIKDGPGNSEDSMLAAGEGVMDFPAIIAAGEGVTEWLIVELDRCETDMLEAVQKSYAYLTGEGLARGNK
jgi:sugar phosphate isomerase/epimerase